MAQVPSHPLPSLFTQWCLVATAMALWLYEGDEEAEHELP